MKISQIGDLDAISFRKTSFFAASMTSIGSVASLSTCIYYHQILFFSICLDIFLFLYFYFILLDSPQFQIKMKTHPRDKGNLSSSCTFLKKEIFYRGFMKVRFFIALIDFSFLYFILYCILLKFKKKTVKILQLVKNWRWGQDPRLDCYGPVFNRK